MPRRIAYPIAIATMPISSLVIADDREVEDRTRDSRDDSSRYRAQEEPPSTRRRGVLSNLRVAACTGRLAVYVVLLLLDGRAAHGT